MPQPWEIAEQRAQLEHTSRKNQPNGYAGLDATGKLAGSQQVYGTIAGTAAEGNDPRFAAGGGVTQAQLLTRISLRG